MRSNAWPERAFAALVAASLEAAWVTLAYVTLEGLLGQAPARLPLLAFAAAALAGMAFGRWSARRPGVPYRAVVVALVVACAVAGWALPLGPAASGVFGAPLATIDLHPSGFLLGLAAFRGTAHVTPEDDERIASRALGPGLGLVAVAWLLLTAGGAVHEPAILEAAFAATLTFVTAGLLSIGLARLADPQSAATLEARRRMLTALLVGVVVTLLAVAIPLALVLGVPVQSAVRGVLGPVSDVGIYLLALLLLPVGVLATLVVQGLAALRDTFGVGGVGGVLAGFADSWQRLLGQDGSDGSGPGILPLLLLLAVALVLMRRLLRRSRVTMVGRDVTEIRETERPAGGISVSRPHLRRTRRRAVPVTASEAYLASLEVLARSPASRRRGTETPSEHARRLRADPVGGDLGRLAADYVLAEFGRRALPGSEHRRAVERWRRIRTALGR